MTPARDITASSAVLWEIALRLASMRYREERAYAQRSGIVEAFGLPVVDVGGEG